MDKLIYESLVRIGAQSMNFNWVEPHKTLNDGEGIGTGFFIDNKGHVLTCAHVITSAVKLFVYIPSKGKESYECKVISVYPEQDIAIIKIDSKFKNSKYLKLGESDKIKAGDKVSAIGYPLGHDKLKVTGGQISGRQEGLIQTDTPLNPGNSGGPLVNEKLEVVGINSAAYKPEDGENVGYAIPISTYKTAASAMFKSKYIHHPSLGCIFHNTNTDLMDFYKYKGGDKKGIYIQKIVKSSPLSNFDIHNGDILTGIDKYDIDNYGETSVDWNYEKIPISTVLDRYLVGDKVKLKYWCHKDSKLKEVNTRFKGTNDIYNVTYKFPQYEKIEFEIFGGLIFMDLALNHVEIFKNLRKYENSINRIDPKIVITHIYTGTSTYNLRILSPGDVIKKVNGKLVSRVTQLRKALMEPINVNGKKYITLEMCGGKFVTLSLENILKEEVFFSQNYQYPLTECSMKYIEEKMKEKSRKSSKNVRDRRSFKLSRKKITN
tara:strand:+ start:539 stop:2008 length:1470 start_codon:yes stop_codon:yes gene_type:complete